MIRLPPPYVLPCVCFHMCALMCADMNKAITMGAPVLDNVRWSSNCTRFLLLNTSVWGVALRDSDV